MKNLIFKFLIFLPGILMLLNVSACKEKKSKVRTQGDSRELRESMVKANKSLTRSEAEGIEAFLSRYGWKMEKTGTGLRYLIYKRSQGKIPVKGDRVKLEYTVMLLNGSPLYTSKTDGPLEFELGKGKTINGLEEGIFLMRQGEKAKFVIPSHLAFGLLGDQRKIPQRATLVYDVELTSINR